MWQLFLKFPKGVRPGPKRMLTGWRSAARGRGAAGRAGLRKAAGLGSGSPRAALCDRMPGSRGHGRGLCTGAHLNRATPYVSEC